MVPIMSANEAVVFENCGQVRYKGVLEIRVLDASQMRVTFSACVFDSESESSLMTQENSTIVRKGVTTP